MSGWWVVTIGEFVHVVQARRGAEAVEAACARAEHAGPVDGIYYAQQAGDNHRYAFRVTRETVWKAVSA